ncbi:uncharacterized protein [Mobula birostris]|uniref:uncharacterized protein n=1 Tax=Mobula birostris TaxID=1983395 RepID=UPI003B28B6FE
MKPLAWNHSERGIYDCSRGPPPPYAASKSIMDESVVASRALVHPTPSHSTTSTKPASVTFQTFNQMVGTVQPIAQAQAYMPQQVHSNNEASSQNIFVYKTVSQPMCQTIYAPGTKQVTLQNKGSALSNNSAQPIALNGVVWMTAAGQMAQTVNNVYSVQFARMMQSHNPMHQNVRQSSKTPVSTSPAAVGAPQGQLNVPDSQGNHSSVLSLTAKDNSRCNDQTQIRSAFRKEDLFQDQGKTHAAVVGTAPARVFHRIWPTPPSYASVAQQIYGDRVKGDSSERAGSSVNLSQQQNGQHDFTNSNGQKRMMLARVTPMSQDWRNLQQNTNAFPTTDINKPKNLQLEDAQLHHKLGSNQESRTVSNAVSASEQLVDMKNTTTPQLSAVRISTQRNGSIASLVPPLLHKPSLHRQQNVHFIYAPATVSEQHTVTSSMSSLKAQHNATSPGNYTSISNTSSKDPVASQLPHLSVGQGIFGVSSSSSNLVSQQTMTVSSVGAGNLCNNDHQNMLPPSIVPHSTNMSCSTFRLESKEGGKHPVHMPPSGFSLTPVRFNQENSQSSSVQLSTTDDCGKQSATNLPLVPPSVVEHNYQIMESSAVYTTLPSASEKDIPAKVIGGQVDASNTVVDTSFSMLEMSKYSASSAANLSGSSGQHCQEMLVHGSSTIGERSEQQKKCANSVPVLIRQPSAGDLSSSFELNGSKRNLTSEIYISHTHPTFCEVQENLAVNNSPPPKRFLASALEDASQDGHSCKNAILCPDKESINSPELLHNEGLNKSGATNVAQDEVAVQPDICITGVFSLGDDKGLWGSVQQENLIDHISPDTSSSVLTSDEMHNSPGPKGLVTVESGMRGKTNRAKECNTTVVSEKGPVMCVPLSNLESSQCHSVTESPRMVHMQPVMERSFDKNIGELSGDSNDPANVLVDLTTADYCSSDSVLPCTFKEHETKLVSDKNCLPFEVNDQHPLSFDKETQDLDELLHSVEAAIETLLNFWNPEFTPCTCGNTGKLIYKHNNLHGRTCESELPNTEEADLNFCGAVQVPDKADLLEGPGCDLSADVKVLGHVEILNLLAEISKSNTHQRLPAEIAESEQFTHSILRLNKETQQKASQNANGDESNEYGAKALERKGRGYKGEPNCAPLQGLNNNNSTIQKGKQQEKKVYCCINAWLVASGVLGINCNCKLSQGSKPESQTNLPTAVHKSQSSSEMSNQNGFANQMEVEPTLNHVPFVTHKNELEISEMRNSTPSLVPDCNQEKPLGEVPPEVCSADAIQQSSEVRTIENEMENLWNPGNANLNGFNASAILTDVVGLEGKLHQKKIEERKEVSLNAIENGPKKEDHAVLEKETDEDKIKNVRRDSSLNVLSEKASDQSDVLQFKQHIVKLGFKVMKRKADSTSCRSPQKKRKIGVQGKKIFVRSRGPQKSNHRRKTKCDFQDAKVLPKYNCRVMIQDKTYSSSGENAVLVSLVPLSGNLHKAMEKVNVKN